MLAVLSSPVCPLQEEVLQQPLLARIMAFVRAQYRVRHAKVVSNGAGLSLPRKPSLRCTCGNRLRAAAPAPCLACDKYQS